MVDYATLETTTSALLDLGFKPYDAVGTFFVSPKNDSNRSSVVKLKVYMCKHGYYCVDAMGGWQAPIVWNGPKAEWDTTDTTAEFVNWLDKHFAGWR